MSAIPDDIGARFIACRRWRWMPGMRWLVRRAAPLEDLVGRVSDLAARDGRPPHRGAVPDPTDPATVGCILALVRDTWGSTAHLVRLPAHEHVDGSADLQPALWWAVAIGTLSVPFVYYGEGRGRYLAGPTEAEALLAELEAAP